jgi:hypothetical protein
MIWGNCFFEVVKSKGHKKWVDYAKQEIKNRNAATRISLKSPKLKLGFSALDGQGTPSSVLAV